MNDIVERLRKWRMWPETSEVAGEDIYVLTREAAYEIERLREELDVNRTALEMKHAEIERLRAANAKAVEALEEIRDMPIMVPLDVYELASATLKELGGGGD